VLKNLDLLLNADVRKACQAAKKIALNEAGRGGQE
jgi:hypothetical protein